MTPSSVQRNPETFRQWKMQLPAAAMSKPRTRYVDGCVLRMIISQNLQHLVTRPFVISCPTPPPSDVRTFTLRLVRRLHFAPPPHLLLLAHIHALPLTPFPSFPQRGMTALHWACLLGLTAVVSELIETYAANVEALDNVMRVTGSVVYTKCLLAKRTVLRNP